MQPDQEIVAFLRAVTQRLEESSLRIDTGTVGNEIRVPPAVPATQTVTPVTIQELGYRRAEARASLEIAGERHQDGHFKEWTNQTSQRARLSVAQLLEDLADLGFAWRDIARLIGVTVQAIQKWRRGESASSSNRNKLAGLLAACDLIAENYEVHEVASWFEIPLLVGAPVTPIDLWAAQRPDLVFDYASGHADAEAVLELWNPDWRDQYRTDFEVFRAEDGQHSIRMKDE